MSLAILSTLLEAKALTERWPREYNEARLDKGVGRVQTALEPDMHWSSKRRMESRLARERAVALTGTPVMCAWAVHGSDKTAQMR